MTGHTAPSHEQDGDGRVLDRAELIEEVRVLTDAVYWARGPWSKDDKKRICATLIKCRDVLLDGTKA